MVPADTITPLFHRSRWKSDHVSHADKLWSERGGMAVDVSRVFPDATERHQSAGCCRSNTEPERAASLRHLQSKWNNGTVEHNPSSAVGLIVGVGVTE